MIISAGKNQFGWFKHQVGNETYHGLEYHHVPIDIHNTFWRRQNLLVIFRRFFWREIPLQIPRSSLVRWTLTWQATRRECGMAFHWSLRHPKWNMRTWLSHCWRIACYCETLGRMLGKWPYTWTLNSHFWSFLNKQGKTIVMTSNDRVLKILRETMEGLLFGHPVTDVWRNC